MVSLEPWDDVWRRNQHLVTELVRSGRASTVWFVEPVVRGHDTMRLRPVRPGVVAVTPVTRLPKSVGGLALVGRRVVRHLSRSADLLWVNDPALGVHCLHRGTPTIYDVTDDWRTSGLPPRIVRRIVRAEDVLARRVGTVVCSDELRTRWRTRYGVDAPVVHNGVDTAAWASPVPVRLPGAGPHVGYVGTLNEQRLDVDLLIDLAARPEIGTVHLVGPDCLDRSRSQLLKQTDGLQLHGPVAAADVPAWMTAMDVLISPHLVNDFTLSLDAIKAHEYAVSGRPVVATPTSGFRTDGDRTSVVAAGGFTDEVVRSAQAGVRVPAGQGSASGADLGGVSWAARAEQFWQAAIQVSGR